MRKVNIYGLSRDIPAEIKREVRRRCGFGCVICGWFIIDYHHIEPPFTQAKKHNPDNIVLLCEKHHGEVTKGLLSDDAIKKASRNPKCLELGFSNYFLDVDGQFPVILLGKSTFVGNPTIIKAFGKRLFFVEPPEEPGGPFRISAEFYDRLGNKVCSIINNEWRGLSSTWDISHVGTEFTVRRAHRHIALQMFLDPPNRLIIKNLDMYYKGFRITVDNGGQVTTYLPDGRMWFRLGEPIFVGNDAVVVIE